MKYIIVCYFCVCSIVLHAQRLISYERVDSFPTAQDVQNFVENQLPGASGLINMEYGVDVYRVIYRTEFKDSLTTVSGAMVVPRNALCKSPLVSYQHGTIAVKTDVPSFGSGERTIGIGFAAEGNVVLLPDYIGLGVSSIPIHPYMHGYSQAHSAINLIRAVREINDEKDLNLSAQLYLFGYSQGGHATAATVRYMEELYADEFRVTAAAPMSGPYNMAGAQSDMVDNGQPYSSPGYLPYVVFSYQMMYENLYNDLSEVFVEPYDSTLFPLFENHQVGFGTINQACPPIPTDIFQPQEYDAYQNNMNHPLRLAIQDNDLLDWTPQSHMKLFYCTEDEQVHYLNAVVADSVWNAHGAPHIESQDYGPFDHGGCVPFALSGGKAYFNRFANNGVDAYAVYDDINNEIEIQVVNDDINNYSLTWEDNVATGPVLENPQPGVQYSVIVENIETGCSYEKTFTLENVVGIHNVSKSHLPLTVFPNPTQDYINIRIPDSEKEMIVRLYNANGKLIVENTYTHQYADMMRLNNLPSGVYSLVGIGEKTYAQKIIRY